MQRTDPFASANGSHKSFKKLLIFTPIVFLYSAICTQRQLHDLSGYCVGESGTSSGFSFTPAPQNTVYLNDEASHNHSHSALAAESPRTETPQLDPIIELFKSITAYNYLSGDLVGKVDPTCRQYTSIEVFKYNYLIWGIAFFLGLQFTHLDDGPL